MPSPPSWLPPTIKGAIAFYQDVHSSSCSEAALLEAKRDLAKSDLFYLLIHYLNRQDVCHPWIFERCREVQKNPNGYLDLWSRDHYKDLADDTPIFTANRGWVTHGDLIVGDRVYSPSGMPTRIVAISNPFHDSKCYKILMKDGAEIICGSRHLWRIRQKHKDRIGDWRLGARAVRFEDKVITTEELKKMAEASKRIDLGAAEALCLPASQQPIDAYILGCWLGDGHSNAAKFTTSTFDFEHFESEFIRAGHSISIYEKRNNCLGIDIDRYDKKKFCSRGHDKEKVGTYKLQCNECRKLWNNGKKAPPATQNGLSYRLRALGLLKQQKKFIPDIYMQASIEQRMELLRGLMDTDGSCDTRGTATFVNTNKILAEQCYELATGLGLKPRFGAYKAKLNGRIIGDCYRVSMQAHSDQPIFKLKRKLERSLARSKYVDSRYVKSVIPVESVPTRCIQVENPDGLYLAGRSLIPTHNSTCITFGLTIQDILNDAEDTICLFSHTKTNAKKFLRQIKREFEINQKLKADFSDILYAEPENQSPLWSEDQGLIVIRKGNPKEPTLKASGLVDGQQTGDHFKKRVYDDTVTQESVTTADQIHKTTEGWEMSISLGTRDGVARYIGTRYSLHDTYNEMLKRKAVIPRIYAATSNGKLDGTPVFFSKKIWAKKLNDLSRPNLASQYLQNPLADEDATFSVLWLKPYEVRPRTLNVYIMCDPSKGLNSSSDNTAIIVIGVSSTGNKYLLDGFCHRMTLSQRWIALRDTYKRWAAEPGVMHIEVGYERYGAQSDDEYFEERKRLEMKSDKIVGEIVIHELSWTREGTKGEQGKRTRVERLEPDFRNGRFLLPLSILYNGKPHTWKVDTNPDSKTYQTIIYSEVQGLTKQQLQALNGGSPDLVCKSIKRYDEEDKVYDLTAKFIQEYMYFPFGEYKDALDAASRLYDMDIRPPVVMLPGSGEPAQFWDS